MNRIKAVAKKELKHLFRDWRMLFVILFFPVFLLGIFGYAVNFDVHNIKIALLDKDKSKESREFLNLLTSSDYFDSPQIIKNTNEITDILNKKIAQAVIVIPINFSEDLTSGKDPAEIQFLVDGVDGNSASIIKNYLEAAVFAYNTKYLEKSAAKFGRKPSAVLDLQPRFWFNPNLESTKFLIPGLIAMILIVTSVISVSLSLVREKERGTMEQIKVSSISTIELLLGKSLPYIIIALIDAAVILIAGYILFDVVIKGSFLLLFLSTLIFIFASTTLGIFISTVSDTQQVAFTAATFATLLPSVILSGFIFPIESMPFAVQIITNITPAKFFIVALRSIILKGVGLHAFYDQLLYLLLFAFVFLALATIATKRKEALV